MFSNVYPKIVPFVR